MVASFFFVDLKALSLFIFVLPLLIFFFFLATFFFSSENFFFKKKKEKKIVGSFLFFFVSPLLAVAFALWTLD